MARDRQRDAAVQPVRQVRRKSGFEPPSQRTFELASGKRQREQRLQQLLGIVTTDRAGRAFPSISA